MYSLTTDEHRFFRHAGYIRSRGRLPEEWVERVGAVVRNHISEEAPPYRVNAAGDVRRLDRLLERDGIFLQTLRLPAVVEPLQSLLGPNIEVRANRHNHATVNRAGDIPFRLHRDILQWTRGIVTAFIYLEDTTVENGCTHVVPGSQYLPFAGMPPDGGGGNWADDHSEYEYVTEQALPVPMPRGGILLIDSLAFHSVGPNSTNHGRMSMTFAFHSVDELSSDTASRVLLTGKRIYMGSDRQEVSGSLRKQPPACRGG